MKVSQSASIGVTPTERLLANLCSRSFLKLWSYANPFKDDGNEFCDVIAIFENHVFIFFDRLKTLSEFEEGQNFLIRWERRKRRVIDAQIKTAHGAERYFRSGRSLFLDAKQAQPFPLPLDRKNAVVHKIIVAHGASDACKAYSDDNISGSLAITYSDGEDGTPLPFCIHINKNAPVHVLDSNTLPILLSELDTARDFSSYLDEKSQAISRLSYLSYCGEEGLLADYWLNIGEDNRHFIGTQEQNVDGIHISEGLWEYVKSLPQYEATKKANQKSYLWDEIIDRTCNYFLSGESLGNSDLFAHRSAVHEMAKEPRFIRRHIVELMLGAVKQFPQDVQGMKRLMRFIPSGDVGKGYVFLQLFIPSGVRPPEGMDIRMVRQEILLIACGSAKNKIPNLQTVISIGIEPPKLCSETAEDLLLLDCTDWDVDRRKEFEERNIGWDFFETKALRSYEGKVTEFVLPVGPKSAQGGSRRPGRNDACPCGSGKKYKWCHGLRMRYGATSGR